MEAKEYTITFAANQKTLTRQELFDWSQESDEQIRYYSGTATYKTTFRWKNKPNKDQQIYLNHKLLEQKQLNLTEVQEKSAEFLMQFSGVNEAYSANRLLLGSWTPEIYKIRNGYHRKRSGDLVIDVLPGWTIVNENGGENKVVRHSYIPSPLIFMGHSVKPAIIQTPVTIEHIAPTLAHFMRIRAPNACTSAPITDLR